MMWCFHSFSNAGFLISSHRINLPTPTRSIPQISFQVYRIPVINDERSVYYHSASIGDFRFGFLHLLFGICHSYRSVSSLALNSYCVLFWYTYTSSSSIWIFYLSLRKTVLLYRFVLHIEQRYYSCSTTFLHRFLPYMTADLDIIHSFMEPSPPSFLRMDLKSAIGAPYRKLLLTSKFMNSDLSCFVNANTKSLRGRFVSEFVVEIFILITVWFLFCIGIMISGMVEGRDWLLNCINGWFGVRNARPSILSNEAKTHLLLDSFPASAL